jgi:hypothetical protein
LAGAQWALAMIEPELGKRIYRATAPHRGFRGLVNLMVAGLALLAGGLTAVLVVTALSQQLAVAGLFAGAGCMAAVIFTLRGYRQLTAPPFVLVGTIDEKQQTIADRDSRVDYRLHLDVDAAFVVLVNGQTMSKDALRVRLTIRAQRALFERVAEGDEVSIVCLPSGEAFAKIQDYERKDG